METKQVYCIDASSLRLTACPQKFINTVVRGLHLYGTKAFKPAFGIAYHKYKALYLDTQDFISASRVALEYYQNIPDSPATGKWSLECLMNTMLRDSQKRDTYTVFRDKEGKALVEQKFKIPMYEDDSIIICLSGTIDALVSIQGQPALLDHKVTESWNKKEFVGKYSMDHQMMMYHYVLDKLSKEYPDTFGIFNDAPALISMIQLTATGIEFEQSPLITFNVEHIADLENHIKYAVELILQYLEAPNAVMRNFSQCSVYGSCAFFDLCFCGRSNEECLINAQYSIKPYDPLKFDEEVGAEVKK